MGREGCEQRNENGQLILDYCHSNNLIIDAVFSLIKTYTNIRGNHRMGVRKIKSTTLQSKDNLEDNYLMCGFSEVQILEVTMKCQ